MFTKFHQARNKPEKPMMIWDGNCGFCKYWILIWKSKTTEVDYQTLQDVAGQFPEIPLKEFKKASRFIDADGKIYSGPDSAFMSMWYFKNPKKHWHRWYMNSSLFQSLSDHSYNFIAKNRSLMMKVTLAFWGENPLKQKSYWLIWLILLLAIIIILVNLNN